MHNTITLDETVDTTGPDLQSTGLIKSAAINEAAQTEKVATVACHPALEFLIAMDRDPAASFNIECYTELPKGYKKPRPDPLLARYPNLRIIEVEQLLLALEVANAAGAGIFFCVNQCQGQRSKKNVARVRCIHGFPAPIKVSPGITACRVDDIREYLNCVGTPSTKVGA